MKPLTRSGSALSESEPVSLFRSPYLWAFVAGITLLTLIRPLLRREPAAPPVLLELPAFSLVDSRGQPFGSAQLDGRVWVASFLFTRCPSICPQLAAAMARLQRRYDEAGIEDIHLVSISVDPDYDTPARLYEYGVEHGVDPRRWTLLTGDRERIRELAAGGFKISMGEPAPRTDSLMDIAHSGKLVLVDGRGRVRGYYDSDGQGEDELFHRSRHVLRDQLP